MSNERISGRAEERVSYLVTLDLRWWRGALFGIAVGLGVGFIAWGPLP